MKYLLVILVIITGMDCSKSTHNHGTSYYINGLDRRTDANTRRIVWLIHQDTIKKMPSTYPEDIKLIQPLLKEYYNEYKPDRTPKRFLIPIPLYQDDENGRLYLFFNPITGINDFYIEINSQQKITVIDTLSYRKEFLGKWRKYGFLQYKQGKPLRNKWSYILYMLK